MPDEPLPLMVPEDEPPPLFAAEDEPALMDAPPPSASGGGLALPPRPLSIDAGAPLPEIDAELPFGDEPKMRLPSFSDSRSGGGADASRLPSLPSLPFSGVVGGGGRDADPAADASGGYKSKLSPINPGKPLYDVDENEKPLFERIVFGLSIGGIAFLIFVEIFINTPLFQQVKPVILNILGGGGS